MLVFFKETIIEIITVFKLGTFENVFHKFTKYELKENY